MRLRRSRARLWCSASGSASALDSQPCGNLVAITTLLPSASSPNRCSDAPPLYIAAVSKKFAPADRLASKASCSSSGPAVPPYASLAGPHRLRPEGLPQVIAPTPSLGTSRSLRPSRTRSVICTASLVLACPSTIEAVPNRGWKTSPELPRRRPAPHPLLDHGVDGGAAGVAVGQHHHARPPVGQQRQAGPPAPVGALVVGQPLPRRQEPQAVAKPPAALGAGGGGERQPQPSRADHPSSRGLAVGASDEAGQ